MTSSVFLWLRAVVCCLAVSGALQGAPPNIVFFLIDDLGWKDLGFMGNPSVRTPHIDRLSREGMVFTDAYANGPNCAPSRASLLSGEYGPRHGVYTVGESDRGARERQKLVPVQNKITLFAAAVTWAEVLSDHGYTLAIAGKWHLGDEPELGPISQGFTVHFGSNHAGQPPNGYFPPYGLPNLEGGAPREYLTDRLTDESVRFLEANRNRPFVLFLAHYAVHTPLQAPEDRVRIYRERTSDGGPGALDPTYGAMIECVDDSVGRVLAELERLGLTANTAVFFMSDNGGVEGTSYLAPLRGGKGMLYEGGIRVPFLVRWPGHVRAGSRCTVPVSGIDLYPTFLEIAGAKPPAGWALDGESLGPLLREEKAAHHRPIFWHFPAYLPGLPAKSLHGARDAYFRTRPAGAVRDGDWKLLQFFEDGAVELYNLRDDPGENHDLSSKQPEIGDRLKRMLHDWKKSVNAPTPTQRNPLYHESL